MGNRYTDDMIFGSAANRLTSHCAYEGEKWCDGTIHAHAVALEPDFNNFHPAKALDEKPPVSGNYFSPRYKRPGRLAVIKAWFSPKDDYKLLALDEMLKQQTVAANPISFEIVGNRSSISVHFVVEATDSSSVINSLKSRFQNSEFLLIDHDPLTLKFDDIKKTRPDSCTGFNIFNFIPHPPYFRTMSVPTEGTPSPTVALFNAINGLEENSEVGFLQIIYKATDPKNAWHSNTENLIYSEINAQGHKSGLFQLPDEGDSFTSFGKTKSIGIEKADPARPFFAACLRFGFICAPKKTNETVQNLLLYVRSYRYGHNHLRFTDKKDFLKVLKTEDALLDMIVSRTSNSHGMLLNSLELSGLMYISPDAFHSPAYRLDYKKGFLVPESLKDEGNELGINFYCGNSTPVKLPVETRFRHIICQGLTGTGKTTCMNNLILDDIHKGYGLIFIDPVGEASNYLLDHIPETRVNDVVYIDPTIEDFVPQVNFCKLDNMANAGRIIDHYLSSFKSLYERWGDNLEYIIKECLTALIHTPNLCLSDMETLISQGKEGDLLRKEVVKYLDNPNSVYFWKYELMKYGFNNISPVKNKMSKLLRSNELGSRIFTQRENLIDFRRAIDESKIVIMNFPSGLLGAETATILSSFMLALFHKAVIGRHETQVDNRHPYFVYLDEFQKFSTDAFEPLMVDARRYRVGIHVFHHMRGQLKKGVETALKNANTVISFKLNRDDASVMAKELLCLVEPDEIASLGVGEAFMRSKDGVVNFKTKPPIAEIDQTTRDKIILNSIDKYYLPLNGDKSQLSRRRLNVSSRPNMVTRTKEFQRIYETFDDDEGEES